jgi:cytochrome P450
MPEAEPTPPAFPFIRDGAHPLNPAPGYADCAPVTRVQPSIGDPVWLVTGYDDVRTVLGDTRFSSDMTAPGYPTLFVPPVILPGAFIALDPPEHTRFRAMLVREFSARRMDALRPRIEAIADAALNDLLAGPAPADLVTTYTGPVPALVICELLGVSEQDRDLFLEWTGTLHRRDVSPAQHEAANLALYSYMDKLVAEKEQRPADDLLGRLVTEQVRPGELSHDELVAFGLLLLAGGLDTTANVLALGTLSLLSDRSQWDALRAQPDLIPGAVEEMLRFHTITQWGIGRAATAEVEIAGQVIRAGEGVIAMLPTANRDEAMFPDPDRFDVRRDARRHVTLGHGVHHCIGQMLARVELQVAMARLTERIPTLALAEPAEDVPLQHDMFVFGAQELRVQW